MQNETASGAVSKPEIIEAAETTPGEVKHARPTRHSIRRAADSRNRLLARLGGVAVAAICAPDVTAAVVRLLVRLVNQLASKIP